jgi:hypothetical protein
MAVPSREQFWQTWSRQTLAPLIQQDLAQRGFRADPVKLADYVAPYYLSGSIPGGGEVDTSRAQWANVQRFDQDYLNLWRTEFQKEATQQGNIQNIYSQVLAETQQKSELLQKQSTAALNQQKMLTQQEQVAAATQQAPVTTTVTQRRRASVGQPGVARTRLSTGTNVGGFTGTSPGRINPTGLNI